MSLPAPLTPLPGSRCWRCWWKKRGPSLAGGARVSGCKALRYVQLLQYLALLRRTWAAIYEPGGTCFV